MDFIVEITRDSREERRVEVEVEVEGRDYLRSAAAISRNH